MAEEKTISYKCPNCNATLEYDARGGNMHCDYCDSDFDVDTLKEYDDILKQEEEDKNGAEPTWNTCEPRRSALIYEYHRGTAVISAKIRQSRDKFASGTLSQALKLSIL